MDSMATVKSIGLGSAVCAKDADMKAENFSYGHVVRIKHDENNEPVYEVLSASAVTPARVDVHPDALRGMSHTEERAAAKAVAKMEKKALSARTKSVLSEIDDERSYQKDKWDEVHDRENDRHAWDGQIHLQMQAAYRSTNHAGWRACLIKMAAVCVAALEHAPEDMGVEEARLFHGDALIDSKSVAGALYGVGVGRAEAAQGEDGLSPDDIAFLRAEAETVLAELNSEKSASVDVSSSTVPPADAASLAPSTQPEDTEDSAQEAPAGNPIANALVAAKEEHDAKRVSPEEVRAAAAEIGASAEAELSSADL